ncbi:unnamed protein product [Symbiodinium sp. KB8]|nr:unnamed protein product [Symbiodinium sp. KB8]
MKISIKQGMFVNDMTDYIFDLKQATLRGKRLQEVDALGLKEFRRLIVSLLAQKVSHATWNDLKEANKLLSSWPRLEKLRLGRTKRRGSFLGGARRPEEGKGNLLEFHSNKISRVVRSSMAAECCSMSSSADRLVCNMKLWDALHYGALVTSSTWRCEIKTQGHLVTDARSLFDHVHGSNQLPAERQTSLDILGIRQMVQEQLVALHWVPTWRQYADCLTKAIEDVLYQCFKQHGRLNVKQSREDAREEERRALLRRAQRERLSSTTWVASLQEGNIRETGALHGGLPRDDPPRALHWVKGYVYVKGVTWQGPDDAAGFERPKKVKKGAKEPSICLYAVPPLEVDDFNTPGPAEASCMAGVVPLEMAPASSLANAAAWRQEEVLEDEAENTRQDDARPDWSVIDVKDLDKPLEREDEDEEEIAEFENARDVKARVMRVESCWEPWR